ncbi:MAG: AAA family ATPase [Mycobacteriales bacterium]
MTNPLLASLRAAVEQNPDDVPLRVHFAEVLLSAGERDESVRQAGAALSRDPSNAAAMRLLTGSGVGDDVPVPPTAPSSDAHADADADLPTERETIARLDAQFADVVPPMFVDGEAEEPIEPAYDVERSAVKLTDVGGMSEVKARLEAAILAPMRNPELMKLYGKSFGGGLLLYGPPGCGKTFIARAIAGEMGAGFMTVSLSDVLDMFIGQSERNLHEIFQTARRNAPCVLFLDEIDALGQKRSQMRHNAARGTVNQLLNEMDGANNANQGVFVLGATNHPWDVDVALRRPGRFDRTLLVLPPDEPAREAILRYHLSERPVANIDTGKLARQTDGFSGADLAYLCESAAETALLDSARSGKVRMIEMRDLEDALRTLKPSIGPWLETARNVAQFANEGGMYDELLVYLRKRKLL